LSFTESLQTIVEENENGLLAKHGSWERIKLGDVCDILNGFAFSSSGFNDSEGIPLLRIRDVTKSKTQTKYVGEFDPQYLVAHGDLLIGMDGDFNAALWRGSEALLNQRVCKLSPDDEFYSRSLLAYAIQGYLDAVNAKTSAITVKHLSSRTVSDIPLPLPPISEQNRIVNFLDGMLTRLDDAVASLERVQRNLERYRASVLKAAVEGRLVPTEAEQARQEGRSYEPAGVLLERILAERKARWIEDAAEKARAKAESKALKAGKTWTPEDNAKALEKARKAAETKYKEPASPDLSASGAQAGTTDLPEGWCWARIDSIGDVKLGRQRAPKHHTGEYMRPYLRVANVFEDRIDTTDVMEMNFTPDEFETYKLEVGDILLNEGQSLDLIGRPAMYNGEVPGACFQNTLVRFRASHLLERRYALMVFLAYMHSGVFQGIARWTTNIAHLGASRFAALHFALPPVCEQGRIVAEVDAVLSRISACKKNADLGIVRSANLRQSILKWAFEGKLVEQDPNDEPASTLLERIRAERSEARQ